MALYSILDTGEFHVQGSDEIQQLYEGIYLERREHNQRGHMPGRRETRPGRYLQSPGVSEVPSTAPPRASGLAAGRDQQAPAKRSRRTTASVERRESLRDMASRLTGRTKP